MPADNSSAAPMDRKVQGAFFVDYVRMMKSRKDVDWAKYLQPEDLVFLGRKIERTEWYPMASFERMGLAILSEIAEGKMERVRLFGRIQAEELARLSKGLCEGKPSESLVSFQMVRGSYFDFDAIRVKVLSHNYTRLEINYHMSPLAEEAACWQAVGYFERLLELSCATSIVSRFGARSWNGDPTTVLEIDWSNVTAEQRVKGSLFLEYVRLIRKHPEVAWSNWLRPVDLEKVGERIDEMGWYPLDSFERMGAAILKDVAHGELDHLRQWGRNGVSYLIKLHPDLISPGDPIETLYRFQVLRRSFFNFNAVEINSISSNYAKLHIDYDMSRSAESAATYQTLGFFERLMEIAGAKKLKSNFLSKSWEGDPVTILELRWD